MANLKEVVIVSACRTAIGDFLGSLKDITMTDMAAICLKEAVNRVGLDVSLIDDVILGVTGYDSAQNNVGRGAALEGWIPRHCSGHDD